MSAEEKIQILEEARELVLLGSEIVFRTDGYKKVMYICTAIDRCVANPRDTNAQDLLDYIKTSLGHKTTFGFWLSQNHEGVLQGIYEEQLSRQQELRHMWLEDMIRQLKGQPRLVPAEGDILPPRLKGLL